VKRAHAVGLLILGACALAPTARADEPAARSPAHASYQSRVAKRLEKLASYLEQEAHKGLQLHQSLAKTEPGSLVGILDRAKIGGNSIARSVQSQFVAADFMTGLSDADGAARTQRILKNVSTQGDAALAYARELRSLSTRIRSAKPSEVSSLLDAAAVPSDVGVLLDPNALSALPAVVPATSVSVYIAGGSFSVDFPAVAALLYPDDAGGLSIKCTATLIAPNALLTAAHCINAGLQKVYFQHAGLFSIDPQDVVINNAYVAAVQGSPSQADLAIIFLKDSIASIIPVKPNAVAAVTPGSQGVIVGYGWHSYPAGDDPDPNGPRLDPRMGIKVFSTTTTSACAGNQAGKNLVCWTYPTGTLVDTLGSTCFGDSGGPFAVQINGAWTLAGVTAGGSDGSLACHPGDHAYDMEVFAYRQWIADTLKAKVSVTPSTSYALQPLANPASLYNLNIAHRSFDASTNSWSTTITVRQSGVGLRVGVNATPSGNPLILVATTSQGASQCQLTVSDAALFCDVASISGGDVWSLTIRGYNAQEYQVVSTQF
jgi:secreted trypsin-like serine protease